VLDIGSAYLEADMTGESVFITVDKMTATIMAHEFPELRAFTESDGTLLMRVKKALYGCLVSGALWYAKLTSVLKDLGFVQNPLDPCVMNKTVSGEQLTVVIFVDDILATCKSDSVITDLVSQLREEFDEVKGGLTDDFSYLGMHVVNNRELGEIEVSMEGYEKEVLEYAGVQGRRSSPATSDLFSVGSSALMGDRELKRFHTIVAKLLYLGLRTRPTIAVAVSYLATRVTCANIDDGKKLDRVLMYMRSTPGQSLTLACHGPLRVVASIDAAFGSHDDGKSHTGVVHKIGTATVMSKSCKQKMTAKDSTEAELVALSDKMDGVLRLDEFVRAQGYVDMPPPEIGQDNMSNISLVTKGGGKPRTEHLRVRQYRVKERVDEGELMITYVATGSMVADLLTKPLQGALLNHMTKMLLGKNRSK